MIFRDDIEVTFSRKNGYNKISAKMDKFFKRKPKSKFNWFLNSDYYIEYDYTKIVDGFYTRYELYKKGEDRRCLVHFDIDIFDKVLHSKTKSKFTENLKVFMDCITEKVELLEQKIIEHKIEMKKSEFEVKLIPSMFNNYGRSTQMDFIITKQYTVEMTLNEINRIAMRLENNSEYTDSDEGREQKRKDDKIVQDFISKANKIMRG